MSQDESQSIEKTVEPSPSESTITLETRHTRSIPMTLLQVLVKPFRPRLITPPKKINNPVGSQKLSPPSSLHSKVDVKQHQLCDIYMCELTPRLPSNIKYRPKHDLYYFAGGSFVMPPNSEHWKFCAELARQLPEYRVYVVSPPLGPTNRADTALPILQKWIDEVLQKADKPSRSVTLAGDSSGGNIAMSLALYAAKRAMEEGEPRTPLKNVLLISPPSDLRKDNPEMDVAERLDPIMTSKHTRWVATQWACASIPAESESISPILADLTSLRKMAIKVHGVVGTYDVLAPDAIAFREKLDTFGVSGKWLQWEKQMHCFPLAWVYKLPDSVQAKNWILELLKENSGAQ